MCPVVAEKTDGLHKVAFWLWLQKIWKKVKSSKICQMIGTKRGFLFILTSFVTANPLSSALQFLPSLYWNDGHNPDNDD